MAKFHIKNFWWAIWRLIFYGTISVINAEEPPTDAEPHADDELGPIKELLVNQKKKEGGSDQYNMIYDWKYEKWKSN